MAKQIIVAVHDATPKFILQLDSVFRRLDELGVKPRTILVVPDHEKRYLITNYKDFVKLLCEQRARGAQLGLHGLHHTHFEFLRLSYSGAKNALALGRSIFFDAFGEYPRSFVAPHWVESVGAFRAVMESDFDCTATFKAIWYRSGKTCRAKPFNFDWGNIIADRIVTRCIARAAERCMSGLILFAIHPMDVANKVFDSEMKILSSLLARGWQPVTFAELGEISIEQCNVAASTRRVRG